MVMVDAVALEDQFSSMAQSIEELKVCLKAMAEAIPHKWVTSEEARKMLHISPKTWQKYRDNRVIPFSQMGKKIYVKMSDIDAFLQSHSTKSV